MESPQRHSLPNTYSGDRVLAREAAGEIAARIAIERGIVPPAPTSQSPGS
ncbi:hypothetical protein [Streptomyces sp. NPDC091416]